MPSEKKKSGKRRELGLLFSSGFVFDGCACFLLAVFLCPAWVWGLLKFLEFGLFGALGRSSTMRGGAQ